MSEWQIVSLIGGIGALILVGSSLSASRLPAGKAARLAVIWVAIFAAAFLLANALGLTQD